MMEKVETDIRKCIDEIKVIRTQRGLSQEALAELAGVGESTIGMMETSRNSPTLKTLLKVCMALEIKLSDLLRNIGQ